MGRETNEKFNDVIINEEENRKALERLATNVKELNWLRTSKNPAKEVSEEIQNLIPMINSDGSEQAQKHYRKVSQYLINKKMLIERGEYESILRQNIQTLFAQTEQYRIDRKNYTFWDLLKGRITKNPSVMNDIKMNKMLSRVRMWDGLPKEKDEDAIAIQPIDDIIKFISKYYNIVGINLDDYTENANKENPNLPAVANGYLSQAQKDLIEMVNWYIGNNSAEETPETHKGEKEQRNPATPEIKETGIPKGPGRQEGTGTQKEPGTQREPGRGFGE